MNSSTRERQQGFILFLRLFRYELNRVAIGNQPSKDAMAYGISKGKNQKSFDLCNSGLKRIRGSETVNEGERCCRMWEGEILIPWCESNMAAWLSLHQHNDSSATVEESQPT